MLNKWARRLEDERYGLWGPRLNRLGVGCRLRSGHYIRKYTFYLVNETMLENTV